MVIPEKCLCRRDFHCISDMSSDMLGYQSSRACWQYSMRDRNRFEIKDTKARSAIANGSRLLTDLDHRSAPARRYRDLISAIASDLGGYDSLSEAQIQLVRSAAGLVVLRERLDLKALHDEKVDTSEYCRISNSLRRVLSTIGLKRVSRDVTPDLRTYLRTRGGQTIEAEDDAA